MEQKPGWNYRFIDSLGMHIAISEKTGVLYTEDKIMYSVEECKLLSKIDYQLPKNVHLIKTVFKGTLISIGK